MKLPTPLIGNKAHQPRKLQFPQREFGKISIVKRSGVSAAMVRSLVLAAL